MASYSGMSLKGEIRESVSLDDDDLSDVEDEVFIRDGKNGYKLAEELTVKRPLMPPRKRTTRSEIRTVFKRRSNCRAFCKPCCYLYIALSIFVGLITLVVVVVSLYPLPLDKLKQWTWLKSQRDETRLNILPCNNLRITDIWAVSFPRLMSESGIRMLDINSDGIEDVLLGFGTGHNNSTLPPDIFCPIFMDVTPPCKGGIIALNGLNGEPIWTRWLDGNVFSLQCSFDIDGDQVNDCLAVGTEGTLLTINSKNGTTIWEVSTDETNLYIASFIPDQNNDTVPDILASLSSLRVLDESDGYLVLLSGKNGEELQKINTPNGTKSFYMPQLLKNSKGFFVLFGTGTPTSPGNLSVMPLMDLSMKKANQEFITLYEDKSKGVLNPSILVDITGDNITDIISSMFSSYLVAIDGETFKQIWNFSIPGNGSESEITPTPGYFNSDNITDFLIIYKVQINSTNGSSNTQAFIVDGKTGKLIDIPSNDSIRTQLGALTLSMDHYGYDMYMFWTKYYADDYHNDTHAGRNIKLNALSQFHQPPGISIFKTDEKKESILSPLKQLRIYANQTGKDMDILGQSEKNENFNIDQRPIVVRKYGTSRQRNNEEEVNDWELPYPDPDYKWSQGSADPNQGYKEFLGTIEDNYPVEDSEVLNKGIRHSNSRDPRNKDDSKSNKTKLNSTKSKKKNLSDGLKGIYDPKNVRLAKNRLLHDLEHMPTDILKDTFIKNEEKRLRKSRFEQRDVGMHYDKVKEKQEIQKTIQDELKTATSYYNLWDIESEREANDKEPTKFRGKRKRKTDPIFSSYKVTSIGAIADSLNATNEANSIDIFFVTYWEPPAISAEDLLRNDIDECVADKILTLTKGEAVSEEKRTNLKRECAEEQKKLRIKYNFFTKLYSLHFGPMTVHRLKIECECVANNVADKCAKILPERLQSWPANLGRLGNGMFLRGP